MFSEILQNSQENTCARVYFLIKLQARPVTLKKRLWHRCLPVIFVKYLRTPFLQNTPGRLLLIILNNHVNIALADAEKYPDLCHTSKMELFGKIVQVIQASNISAKSFTLDVWHGSE